MRVEVENFIGYLAEVKKASNNTQVSYRRDLLQMVEYLEKQGIYEISKVTMTSLNSFMLYLEKEGRAVTTMSRVLASMKAFFSYACEKNFITNSPSAMIKAPRVEKKKPSILSVEEVNCLLKQPSGTSPKEIRDKAMLEMLYATGIRVSELTHLKVSDVNIEIGFITCKDQYKERNIPFGKPAKQALLGYLNGARNILLKGNESEWLFTNCSGQPMSRQGFWKIIKFYGKMAKIEGDITPHTLRHSFAAHLIKGGADIHAVQTMMGHSDMSTTQLYSTYIKEEISRGVYLEAHPRR